MVVRRRRRCTTPQHMRSTTHNHTRTSRDSCDTTVLSCMWLSTICRRATQGNQHRGKTTARVYDACVRVTHLHHGRSKRHFACILDCLTNQKGDRTEDHYEAGDADEDRPHHVWTCRALCAVQFAVPWLANTAKRASVPAHTTNHQQLSARQHHDTHASQAGTTRTPLHTPPERRASRRHHFRRWW